MRRGLRRHRGADKAAAGREAREFCDDATERRRRARLNEIQRIASVARLFIEPVWGRWHRSRGHASLHPPARYTCGRTSLFLRDVLRHEGYPAEWMSGTPYAGGRGAPDAACGFHSGTRWEGHAWVVSGKIIVDITADQFGDNPVVVTSTSDARYVGSMDLADPAAIEARREAVVALWPDWMAFRSNFDLPRKS